MSSDWLREDPNVAEGYHYHTNYLRRKNLRQNTKVGAEQDWGVRECITKKNLSKFQYQSAGYGYDGIWRRRGGVLGN